MVNTKIENANALYINRRKPEKTTKKKIEIVKIHWKFVTFLKIRRLERATENPPAGEAEFRRFDGRRNPVTFLTRAFTK